MVMECRTVRHFWWQSIMKVCRQWCGTSVFRKSCLTVLLLIHRWWKTILSAVGTVLIPVDGGSSDVCTDVRWYSSKCIKLSDGSAHILLVMATEYRVVRQWWTCLVVKEKVKIPGSAILLLYWSPRAFKRCCKWWMIKGMPKRWLGLSDVIWGTVYCELTLLTVGGRDTSKW